MSSERGAGETLSAMPTLAVGVIWELSISKGVEASVDCRRFGIGCAFE